MKKSICKQLVIRDGLFYRDYKCKLKESPYERKKKTLCKDCPIQLKLDFK